MSNIKHIIRLNKRERDKLQKFIEDSASSEREVLRANILLCSDTGKYGQPKNVEEIMEQFHTNRMTINRVRQSYLENGLERAIQGKKRTYPPVPAKVDRGVETKIVRIFLSRPPDGKLRWSLSMIAQRAQEKGIVDSISTTRVSQILAKHGYNTLFR